AFESKPFCFHWYSACSPSRPGIISPLSPRGILKVRSTPVTPSPGAPVPAPMRQNDAYFDLLIETLEGLEPVARAQFLQRFFQSLSHIDIPENQVLGVWEEVLTRRTQLSERSDSLVSFQTALVDVLSSTGK